MRERSLDDARPRRSRAVTRAALCAAVLLLSACGSQVSHQRVVAAAGGSGATAAGGTKQASAVPGAANGLTASDPTAAAGTGGIGAPGAAATGDAAGAAAADGAGASGGSGGAPASGTPVTLGNIGSYSGVLGSIFPGGPAAVQAWAQAVNARGGLNGHPVRMVTGDDGGDPARALSLARQMVEEQGAIGFVGNMMPLSLSGILGYLEANNIPLIGGDVTEPEWIHTPMIFPMGTDVQSISTGAVNLMRQGGGTKLAVLYCGEAPACKGLADGAQATPNPAIPVVYTAQISIVQTDFTTECLQAKSQGADAIFVAADANSVIRVGRSCAQQQYKPIYGTASIAVGPQLAGDPNMEGLIAPVNNAPWFDTSTAGGAEFVQSMATYAGGAPLAATAASMYASGRIVELAAKAFSATPTKEELVAGLRALRNITGDGTIPNVSFNDGPSGPIPCYYVVKVSGGQWTAPNGSNPVCS